MTDLVKVPNAPQTKLHTLADAQAFVTAHKAELQAAGEKPLVVNLTGHRESDFPEWNLTTLETLTGPRPEHDPYDPLWSYNPKVAALLIDWLARIFIEKGVTLVHTGMAKGFDLIGAAAANRAGIPFVAFLPFESQATTWPKTIQAIHTKYLANAALVVCVTPVTTIQNDNARNLNDLNRSKMVKAMHDRNKAMLLCADEVISLDQGKKYGGTRHCVDTAERMKMKVTNVWPAFEALLKRPDVLQLAQSNLGFHTRYESYDDRGITKAKAVSKPVPNGFGDAFHSEMARAERIVKGEILTTPETPTPSTPLDTAISELSF